MRHHKDSNQALDRMRHLAADLREHADSVSDHQLLGGRPQRLYGIGRIFMFTTMDKEEQDEEREEMKQTALAVAVRAGPLVQADRNSPAAGPTLEVHYFRDNRILRDQAVRYVIGQNDVIADFLPTPADESYHSQLVTRLGGRALDHAREAVESDYRSPADDELAAMVGFARDQHNMTLAYVPGSPFYKGHPVGLMPPRLMPLDVPPLPPEQKDQTA